MQIELWKSYIEIIRKEVIPALGCTEPIAVAFAAARARELLNNYPEKIEVIVSRNILKNAMGVGIPGTGMIGLDIAAALGAVGGKASEGLEVLKNIDSFDIAGAKQLLEEGKIDIKYSDKNATLYIEVIITDNKDISRVIIEGSHTNIILEELNNRTIFQKRLDDYKEDELNAEVLKRMTIEKIYDFALRVPLHNVEFIFESVRLNNAISKEGLLNNYGLKVGKTIENSIENGYFSRDIITEVVKRTVSATDARMAGSMLPVMSNSGSGNQGIIATMPVITVAEMLDVDYEKMIRALILSHLVTIYSKSKFHRLNPLCGAVLSSVGAGCGITYLMGGDYEKIKYTIFNIIGNISGMICDGAKSSCSLKAGACVNAAFQAAVLAVNNTGVTEKEGIIDKDVDKTIQNLEIISNVGMAATDGVILEIMLSKEKHM